MLYNSWYKITARFHKHLGRSLNEEVKCFMDHFALLSAHFISERLNGFLVRFSHTFFAIGMWKIWSTIWATSLSYCSYLLVQSISHYFNYDMFSCNLLPEQFLSSILTAINGETWPLRSKGTIDVPLKLGAVPTQPTDSSFFHPERNLINMPPELSFTHTATKQLLFAVILSFVSVIHRNLRKLYILCLPCVKFRKWRHKAKTVWIRLWMFQIQKYWTYFDYIWNFEGGKGFGAYAQQRVNLTLVCTCQIEPILYMKRKSKVNVKSLK